MPSRFIRLFSTVVISTAFVLCSCTQLTKDGQEDRTVPSGATEKIPPVTLDPKSVEAGREIFDRATCEGCHPAGGNTRNPKRPLKGAEFAYVYRDDKTLTDRIRTGGPGDMPAFDETEISDKEMKDLISYIRSLSTPPPIPSGPNTSGDK